MGDLFYLFFEKAVYTMRIRIIERLKAQLNGICPVLIKGSVSEETLRPLSPQPCP